MRSWRVASPGGHDTGMGGAGGVVQVFRSKVGGPFILASAIVLGLGGAGLTNAVLTGSPVQAAVCALPMVLLAWMFVTTQYTVTDADLQIRCMFSRGSIPLRSIQRLR